MLFVDSTGLADAFRPAAIPLMTTQSFGEQTPVSAQDDSSAENITLTFLVLTSKLLRGMVSISDATCFRFKQNSDAGDLAKYNMR